MHELLQNYSRLDWKLFPITPNDKTPLVKWTEKATYNPAILMQWQDKHPGCNWAWAVPSGYLVLDVDCKNGKDGLATLNALQAEHGDLPPCPQQLTPSGGLHLVFRLPDGISVKNSVGALGEGLDTRTQGGYVLVSPSSIGGNSYEWKTLPWEIDIPEAPPWLIGICRGGAMALAPRQFVEGAPIREGGRNNALTKLAGALRRRGLGEDAILAALLAENQSRCDPPLDEREVEAIARSIGSRDAAYDYADGPAGWLTRIEACSNADDALAVAKCVHADEGLSNTTRESLLKQCAKVAGVGIKVLKADITAALPAPVIDGQLLPVIELRPGDFAANVDAAKHVIATIPTVFQRAGGLVEAVPGGTGVLINKISAPHLAYLLARHARFVAGGMDATPPFDVVAAALTCRHWPGVRPLAGVTTRPTLDSDGRIIGPGYHHERGGWLYAYRESDFPAYTDPMADALGDLRWLISGFPFKSPVDEAAALAAILTAAVRPVLPTAPAFLISASDYGSGKTLLAQTIAAFAGGASPRPWPHRFEEQAKVLFASLDEGRPCLLYDNISSDIRGDALAAALTSPTYTDRVLGVTANREVSTAALFLMTGNNIRAVEDLARRVVTIAIDPRCENPSTRCFDFDPLQTVQENPGAWTMAALRVMQAWFEAGRPRAALPVVGSFSTWSDMIRQTLAWLGLPDPAAGLLSSLETDPDRELLARFVYGWLAEFSGMALTVREILTITSRAGYDDPSGVRTVMLEIAGERNDQIDAQKFGRWLGRVSGRVVDGYRLVQAKKTKRGVPWAVVTVEP